MSHGALTAMIDNTMELFVFNNFTSLDKTVSRSYAVSVVSLISSLKANPTESEKSVIRKKAQDALNAANALITSQAGMENVLTDKSLRSMPENSEFFQYVDETEAILNEFIANPQNAMDYVSTNVDELAFKYAHYAFVMKDFIKRYQTGKLNVKKNSNRQNHSDLKNFICVKSQ
jgi:aconitase B